MSDLSKLEGCLVVLLKPVLRLSERVAPRVMERAWAWVDRHFPDEQPAEKKR